MQDDHDPAAARRAYETVDIDGWTERFALLSDPTRLRLLLCLHYMPGLNVGQIANVTEVSPTVVSQSLRRPRGNGWVVSEKDGREQIYRLTDERLHAMLHAIGARHAGE
ncbi:metalloregulator ArsR/SmtB family transcription factor [Humibacter sp.]|jgi:DNA-binding transcriptional ArsR family regulator|uniref:ArsR/SmtB family transcription factor n=1 Tax=Humibacter sp. TaxID=1940291 RepID=UPI002CBA7000|nr:metalloregulator ArsR/SmtB family transcription factor [Humibacter sp.]HVX09381.1 metalloregulator ArsR/SmtB family transcription factor [Humibacter sp.]